jgi:hypothetical protein
LLRTGRASATSTSAPASRIRGHRLRRRAFQYKDFTKPWSERRIAVTAGFEPEIGLKAYRAWEDKKDRHPY